jgi:uncharacterized protein
MRRRLLAMSIVTLATTVVAAPAAFAVVGRDRPTVPVVSLSVPGARGSGTENLSGLMTAVLGDVDGYWTRVLDENGYTEPSVRYDWIPSGTSVIDGCSGEATDETAAFYCPADDTIYLSETFAGAVRDGDIQGWPSGDRVRSALGDMAVAYVIAHEEAHNIQQEIGAADLGLPTVNLELHADCLAGAWAGDAASRGVVDTNDVSIAKVTAWLVGDYELHNPGHHGTPKQRRQAFVTGFDDLSSCRTYLAA